MTISQLINQALNGISVLLHQIILPRECTGQQPRDHSLKEYAIQVCEVMLQLLSFTCIQSRGTDCFVCREEGNKGMLPICKMDGGGGGVGG